MRGIFNLMINFKMKLFNQKLWNNIIIDISYIGII